MARFVSILRGEAATERWLETAITPLPVTVRLNPLRPDRAWTVERLQAMGATPLTFTGTVPGTPARTSPDGTSTPAIPELPRAWQLPWSRTTKPAEHEDLLSALHHSGRVTRQEAASMLPPLALDPRPGQRVLDTCAAPGSKATQLAEMMLDRGVVVANEHQPPRVNMLSTNRTRLGLTSLVLTQHDGRHLPRVPAPGFDGVVCDVPCTGSATHRKNREVWTKWSPADGRSLHRLQVAIAQRGARLLRPGGRLVYATCSIDPVENEAVVAALLRRCPWLEVEAVPAHRWPGLTLHEGLTAWDTVEDSIEVWDGEGSPSGSGWKAGVHAPGVLPEALAEGGEAREAARETEIAAQLRNCVRMWPEDHDTGGFFLAVLRQIDDLDEDPRARGLREDRLPKGVSAVVRQIRPPNRHTLVPAAEEALASVTERYGRLDVASLAGWQRGRQMTVVPEAIGAWLWAPSRPDGRGGRWPGGHWQPLKVIDAGLQGFTQGGTAWRPRSHALWALTEVMREQAPVMPRWLAQALLEGWSPTREQLEAMVAGPVDAQALAELDEVPVPAGVPTPADLTDCGLVAGERIPGGGVVWRLPLEQHETWLPTWLGGRLSLMLPEEEVLVLRTQFGLGPAPPAVLTVA